MSKSPEAFRTISEVAEWLGVQAHVLRFWESKFSQVKPVKRAGGRRYYRPSDMELLGGIKKLLYDDGMTIKGVQKVLREQGVAHVSSFCAPPGTEDDIGGTVLEFKAPGDSVTTTDVETPEGSTPEAPAPEQGDLLGSVPDTVTEETGDNAQPEEDAALEFKHVSDTSEAIDSDTTTSVPETAEPATAKAPSVPELPSFLHHRSKQQPEQDATDTTDDSPSLAEETPTQRARVVDAPDPPLDSELPAASGVLTSLSKIDRLGTEQASEIAPIVEELRIWLKRVGSARAT